MKPNSKVKSHEGDYPDTPLERDRCVLPLAVGDGKLAHLNPWWNWLNSWATHLTPKLCLPVRHMTSLRIGRVENFYCGDKELQIKLEASKEFSFTFFQRPDEVRPWCETVPASEDVSKLQHILHKRLQWFYDARP